MAITKGDQIIAGGTNGSAGYQIHYFNTKAEYQAALAAGQIEEDKYYSYPDFATSEYETTMKVLCEDGTTKEYIIFCKEV